MTVFRYRATTTEGQIHKGQIEALHEIDLEAQLKSTGLFLLTAKASQSRQSIIKRMPRRELIDFLFQIEMLIRAGVPLLTAIADLRDDAESHASRELSSGLFEKIEAGSTFANAIAAYPKIFSTTVISLIRSAEATGQLPEVLQEIVRSLKWDDEMAATTKKLLLYPSFVIVVISGVIAFLLTYLVPQLVGFIINMGQEIPFQTRLLIALSDFVVNYWWAILTVPPLLVFLVLVLSATQPNVRFYLHQQQLAIPFLGEVLKKIALARFADTLAMMYRTGVPLIESLIFCQDISSNMVIQQAIRRARERLINGTVLSQSFAAESLFPKIVIHMLRVGESTGGLDTSLRNISYFYTRDINESVGKVQALIEPVMTVAMGLILGWIMMAVLGPIYDTISNMKS